TEEEVELAVKNNYLPITLGNERLRTETAGLYTVTAFAFEFS
ncbi:MAG: 16S rRNA (uracil(1498)-N(3))-methyltransferase, partial [Bacteroidia bacterium]